MPRHRGSHISTRKRKLTAWWRSEVLSIVQYACNQLVYLLIHCIHFQKSCLQEARKMPRRTQITSKIWSFVLPKWYIIRNTGILFQGPPTQRRQRRNKRSKPDTNTWWKLAAVLSSFHESPGAGDSCPGCGRMRILSSHVLLIVLERIDLLWLWPFIQMSWE